MEPIPTTLSYVTDDVGLTARVTTRFLEPSGPPREATWVSHEGVEHVLVKENPRTPGTRFVRTAEENFSVELRSDGVEPLGSWVGHSVVIRTPGDGCRWVTDMPASRVAREGTWTRDGDGWQVAMRKDHREYLIATDAEGAPRSLSTLERRANGGAVTREARPSEWKEVGGAWVPTRVVWTLTHTHAEETLLRLTEEMTVEEVRVTDERLDPHPPRESLLTDGSIGALRRYDDHGAYRIEGETGFKITTVSESAV